MSKKILVVGAGVAGAVVARELADRDFEETVVEQRDHIAGNAYDFIDNETGVRVHRYGPHSWHTNSTVAQDWMSRFTEWVDYKLVVRAMLEDGRTVPLPVNLDTVEAIYSHLFPLGRDDRRAKKLLESMRLGNAHEAQNAWEQTQATVGPELAEIFFKRYSEKMWGMPMVELSPAVSGRLPVKTDRDPFYFPNDRFQCLPRDGYTAAVERMLDHPLIDVHLSTSREAWHHHGVHETKYDMVFTSEPIDAYYNFEYGELPWRSIKFHHKTLPIPRVFSTTVTNFTDTNKYTRVTEWKNFPNQDVPHLAHNLTLLTFEEPCDYRDNNNERYYPVKTALGAQPIVRERFDQYRTRSGQDYKRVRFIGRCGNYVYVDMDQAILMSLSVVDKYLTDLDRGIFVTG